ncbi:4-alpha-glucanotransferase [Sphingomonas sp. R86521]|uniref:4-alpha-glucanotransferase n=1 Tax=Sphingomonas sp. R86521 TaxID=3093860 RepID=UPI0036D3827A
MTLREQAVAAGLQPEWTDAGGRDHIVPEEALRSILDALGDGDDGAGAFASADVGTSFTLPADWRGRAELVLEGGDTRSVAVEDIARAGIDIAGYHRLRQDSRELRLVVAPARCFTVDDAAPGGRLWGPAVQIPSLRGATPRAFGDFGTLAEAARAFGGCGADALAISPTHALFPADASRFSPYAPSSRQFLNVLLADPALAGIHAVPDEAELIDWRGALPARLIALRTLYDSQSEAFAQPLAAFRQAGGNALEGHARFDALHAHFIAVDGARGWQDWPATFHDPDGTAVRAFVEAHPADVAFYAFLQWLAREGLDAAQRSARDAGMRIGLIADLAVGLDRGGSHGWSRRGDLLAGLSIGAPPDPLGPDGQNWGISGFDPRALRRSGFDPFVATIRSALASAGGIRIDHAFGLRRLWVVPDGASAAEGAYLDMPFADMMRIVALESQRAKAIVIGEDLGTLPEGFREAMTERAMMGMRVLWFERDADGFVPGDGWDRDAVAMTGTHDLPTVAGWWQGRDIDWTWALGRRSEAVDEAADRTARVEDRHQLWAAFDTWDAEPAPDDTAPVVDLAVTRMAETPCALAILPIEDLVGLVEQPNLPGTIDEHPNWRRRMPDTSDALLARPDVAARIDAINTGRTA